MCVVCACICLLSAPCTPACQVQVSFNKNHINALTFHMCHKNVSRTTGVGAHKLKEKHRKWQSRRWRRRRLRRVGNQQHNKIEASCCRRSSLLALHALPLALQPSTLANLSYCYKWTRRSRTFSCYCKAVIDSDEKIHFEPSEGLLMELKPNARTKRIKEEIH